MATGVCGLYLDMVYPNYPLTLSPQSLHTHTSIHCEPLRTLSSIHSVASCIPLIADLMSRSLPDVDDGADFNSLIDVSKWVNRVCVCVCESAYGQCVRVHMVRVVMGQCL